MKKKSIVALMAIGAFGLSGLAACSSDSGSGSGSSASATTPSSDMTGSSTEAAGKYTKAGDAIPAGSVIGVALPQKTSENWTLAENLFNQDLTAAGFKPQVQFANGGVSDQQNQISAMITNGAKVIVVGAIDGNQLGAQLQQAKDAGITIIAYDRMLTNTQNIDNYIAFDNFKVGELQGTALLKGLATKGSGPFNIELVAGSNDDANSKPFFEGAMSVLQPKIDDGTLKVLSGQTTQDQVATQGWLAANVQKRFDTILSSYYESASLDGVLSPNDTLARGVLASVAQAGKPNPIITGQDSEVESVKLIMAGTQYSTIYKDTRKLVAQTVESILFASNGQPLPSNDKVNNGVKDVPTQFLEPILVTKDNAAEVYAGDPTLEPLTK